MNYRQTIFIGITCFLFIVMQKPLYSQIEYRYNAQAFGKYFTGNDLTTNHLEVDYILNNKRVGLGGAIGYNFSNSISMNAGYAMSFNEFLDESEAQNFYYTDQTIFIQLNYTVFPIKKLSPYVFADINYNMAELEIKKYFISTDGSYYESGLDYRQRINQIGYVIGAGIKLQLKINWEIFVNISRDINLLNSYASEIGVQYSFSTKKH